MAPRDQHKAELLLFEFNPELGICLICSEGEEVILNVDIGRQVKPITDCRGAKLLQICRAVLGRLESMRDGKPLMWSLPLWIFPASMAHDSGSKLNQIIIKGHKDYSLVFGLVEFQLLAKVVCPVTERGQPMRKLALIVLPTIHAIS
jgi:hypothetical protein